VHTTDLQSGKEMIFDYDSLVVTTGARAAIPQHINGINQAGVFFIRNYSGY
jgi:lysine/ornithine N-monooxygenase